MTDTRTPSGKPPVTTEVEVSPAWSAASDGVFDRSCRLGEHFLINDLGVRPDLPAPLYTLVKQAIAAGVSASAVTLRGDGWLREEPSAPPAPDAEA